MKKKNRTEMRLLGRKGNFLIKSVADGQSRFIRIMTADGGWKMDFRDDNMRYSWVLMCLGSENTGVQQALESWIVLLYHAAHVFPDTEYFEDSIAALTALNERNARRFDRNEEEGQEEEPQETADGNEEEEERE